MLIGAFTTVIQFLPRIATEQGLDSSTVSSTGYVQLTRSCGLIFDAGFLSEASNLGTSSLVAGSCNMSRFWSAGRCYK